MATPHAAPVPSQQGNGLAVAGMVLGILGLVLCWVPFLGWLCALIGIVLGALGMSKAKKVGGKGKGMAIAGLVCGILGLLIGVVLFVLATMAVREFGSYVSKGKRTEASLHLRSMEMKVKTFYNEKSRFPVSAAMMPGPAGSACSDPSNRIARKPPAAWESEAGWREMGFHIDEDSFYSYQWTSSGSGSQATGEAIAVGDIDCDGTLTTTTARFKVVEGNVVVEYEDPTPD
jgi:hypothetical protein